MSYTAASRFANASDYNTYGPNDNFDLGASPHALPALIRESHDAKAEGCEEVVIWGTGAPRRESLRVNDLADACVFIMQRYNEHIHINVGAGEDLSVRELPETVREIVCPGVRLASGMSKPGGTPRRLLDVSRLHALGWKHQIGLCTGIARAHRWLLANHDHIRERHGTPTRSGTR